MKRLGIITYQKVGNYGADLQAYALQAKLTAQGYLAENIDYLYYKHPRFKETQKSKCVLPLSFKMRLKAKLFPYFTKLRECAHPKLAKKRACLFEAFENEFLVCSKEYRTIDDIYDNPPKYDVYIAGSDQIWNPRSNTSIKPYFLDFAPKGSKCISYASSFGVSQLPGSAFYLFKKLLSRFNAVSVREKSGLTLIKSMSLNVETKHVIDPTLLLTAEEWTKVSKRPEAAPDGSFVLLYDLIASPECVSLAHRWARELNCNVIRIGSGAYGPSEFVWLFANASAVVTTSFHGTVFSVLNNKLFYSVIPSGMTNSGRIESLLSGLKLNKRMIRADECCSVNLTTVIDYGPVNEHVKNKCDDSLAFLIRAIEEPPIRHAVREPIASYAVWNTDGQIRAESTSGGLFSVLAGNVLSQNGVVFGAAFTDDFKAVRHIGVTSVDELKSLMKSKYVWSDPTDAYKEAVELLKVGKKVLFSGTPCQVAAVTKLAKGYQDNLVTVDFVCHGTPKADVWAAYANELEKREGSKLTRYEFRNKDKGWNFQNIYYSFANGKCCRVIPWNDPYFHGFSINAFLREVCYKCPFANPERPSDFTIADCWRVAASHPEYDDNKGTSLVLINSKKADALWRELLNSNKISGGEYDFDMAQIRNSALMNPASKPTCYDSFDAEFKRTNSFAMASRVYCSWKKKRSGIPLLIL